MSRVTFTRAALGDLERLRKFLQAKNPAAARRAAQAIQNAIKAISVLPEGYRPVQDLPYHREIVIEFGSSGYVARYFYKPNGEVIVLRIKHQLEDHFP
jgi:plasmid stabilization system protein ParE